MVSSRSGRPRMKPSLRPVSSTSPPALSMAARAAFTRASGQVEVVERLGLVAGEVLDRQARHAGAAAQPHALGHALRRVGVAALEVGVHRHVGRSRQFGDVGQHVMSRVTPPSRQPARPGKARAGRRQRLEAQGLQIARRADIPGVGNDEAPALVQPPELAPLVSNCRHGRPPVCYSVAGRREDAATRSAMPRTASKRRFDARRTISIVRDDASAAEAAVDGHDLAGHVARLACRRAGTR